MRTGSPDVLATAYVRPGKTLVAVASWAKAPVECRLKIDWAALRLDPAKAVLTAPEIKDFQPARRFAPSEAIPVAPGRGWVLVVEERMSRVPGLFITGTDTGVGKTYVAALIARRLAQQGRKVGVYKPAASGCRRRGGVLVSDDAVALWEAAGRPGDLEHVCPQRFEAPLAPHLAAAAEGRQLDAGLLRRGLEYWQRAVRNHPGGGRRRLDVALGRARVRGRPGRGVRLSVAGGFAQRAGLHQSDPPDPDRGGGVPPERKRGQSPFAFVVQASRLRPLTGAGETPAPQSKDWR